MFSIPFVSTKSLVAMQLLILLFVFAVTKINGYNSNFHYDNIENENKLEEVFKWKQITYDFNGQVYKSDTNCESKSCGSTHNKETSDADKFFIQYNNVPIGLEMSNNRLFVTVPRRRHGIPSTLNYVDMNSRNKSPDLKPYPNIGAAKTIISVYRPRVDRCSRLWMVDTGLLEVPGERKQIQPPKIIIYNLKTDTEVLTYQLKPTDLVDERTPAGLTSISVDVNPKDCNDTFAYITDLATDGLIVFSLKDRDSWRISHESFVHDASALNFTVAGNLIDWRDGIFSLAISEPGPDGSKTAFYHPLASTKEFSINTGILKNKINTRDFGRFFKTLGERGINTQSGTHDYHAGSKNLFFANVAQDAITCWNVRKPMSPRNVAIVVRDHKKLVYISDLKVIGDYVWVLVNQIPRFVYSTLDTNENNFFIHKARVQDLVRGTVCEL